MAVLEQERLIVRLAYAGPPLAGKTESMRALLRQLRGEGNHVFSPGEARGRTIFFDWADYEAGSFQGLPIRCQITSVPGQAVLSSRRETLVKAADAVILVIDSRQEALDDARRCYEELLPWLGDASREAPVQLVLQCNKQDLPESLAPEELREHLRLPPSSEVYATSAKTGKGLRLAFIAGVRLAIARARTLLEYHQILTNPDVTSGQELLARLQREASVPDPAQRPPTEKEAPLPPEALATIRRRPAVMPADAYRKLVESVRPGAPSGSEGPEPVVASNEPPKSTPAESPAPAPSPASPSKNALHPGASRVRPAVMPARAFAAWSAAQPILIPNSAAAPAASPIAAPPPPQNGAGHAVIESAIVSQHRSTTPASAARPSAARPAVMPARVYRQDPERYGGRPEPIAQKPKLTADLPKLTADNSQPNPNAPRSTTSLPKVALDATPNPPARSPSARNPGAPKPAAGPARSETRLRLPGRALSPNQVWPAARFRVFERVAANVVFAIPDARGGFHGEAAPGWYAHTFSNPLGPAEADALFGQTISRHEKLEGYLSPARCLALTTERDGLRLWQIVARVPTLAARLEDAIDRHQRSEVIADVLIESAVRYIAALERMRQAPEVLPLGLGKIGLHEGELVYTGLLPANESHLRKSPEDLGAALEAALRERLPDTRTRITDLPAVLTAFQLKAISRLPDAAIEMICSVLIGH